MASELTRNRELSTTGSLPSRETSPNTPPVPDRETALVISSIIDRARAAMGWNALPQTSAMGEQSPQDLAIISWFEICSDAGMRLEQYTPCYRAAQQRKRELLAQGKELTVVTPHDLCAELDRVRQMHAELDKTRLLTANARGACSRCFGTGFERMPDGSVRPGCPHDQWTDEDESALEANEERRREEVKRQADFMREALKTIGTPKPPPVTEKPQPPVGIWLQCSKCPNRVNVLYFEAGQTCGRLLDAHTDPKLCDGTLNQS